MTDAGWIEPVIPGPLIENRRSADRRGVDVLAEGQRPRIERALRGRGAGRASVGAFVSIVKPTLAATAACPLLGVKVTLAV